MYFSKMFELRKLFWGVISFQVIASIKEAQGGQSPSIIESGESAGCVIL